jgi:hypothetical protein
LFRCSEEFHFNGDYEDIEFCEMQEGDEIALFWDAINERTRERKYNSLLNSKNYFSKNLLNLLLL